MNITLPTILILCIVTALHPCAAQDRPKQKTINLANEPVVKDIDGKRYVIWTINTKAIFDNSIIQVLDLDWTPYCSSITDTEITPVKEKFKDLAGPLESKITRSQVKGWAWNCVVYKHMEHDMSENKRTPIPIREVNFTTDTEEEGDIVAKRILILDQEYRKHTYKLTNLQQPPPSGVIRYVEKVERNYNIGFVSELETVTRIIAVGVPKSN